MLKEFHEMSNAELEAETLLRTRGLCPCSMCGKLCNIVDICSEGYFCSRKCLDKFYDEFTENLK